MNDLDTTLSAMADPIRRRVIYELRKGPRRAGELAKRARMSAPAMSRHLRVLRSSGLVDVETDEEDARLRLYRLRPEPLVALRAWLDQLEAFWAEQLGSFKAQADRTRRTRRS